MTQSGHDGCDVRLVIEQGSTCDVRLAAKLSEAETAKRRCLTQNEILAVAVEHLENTPHHGNCLACWAELLRHDNPTEYAEPPPPPTPCRAEPGTEARIQAMEDRANRLRCLGCEWTGTIEQLVRIFVTRTPRSLRPRRGCPWCGEKVTPSLRGLYHRDDVTLNEIDRAARDVTRGPNGREISGTLRDVTS